MFLSNLLSRLVLMRYKMRPPPTNQRLEKLMAGTDRILIKDSCVSRGKAWNNEVVLSITDAAGVKTCSELLEIVEPSEWFGCMCLGDYAIEFYQGQRRRATIGLHHGFSIRYDKWYGDAKLAKADQLLQFLAERGLRKPLEDQEETRKQNEAYALQQRQWLEVAPDCFANYTEHHNLTLMFPVEQIEQELEAEIPGTQERITRLLRTYGCSESPWSGYPSYEELPHQLLERVPAAELFAAYLASDRNYHLRKGLGRYTGCYQSRHQRTAFLEYMSLEVIAELQACFNHLNDTQGKDRMETLRTEKEQMLSQ